MALYVLTMTNNEIMDVWVGATRYYLGRSTAAVASYCETLRSLWSNLPVPTQQIIQRDVEEAFARDDAQRAYFAGPVPGACVLALGNDCDRDAWSLVRALWQQEESII